MLRSKSPPLVRQEIWGHLCCHYAIRTLMRDAATAGSHDPDRMSFVAALRITRRSLSHSSLPPPSRNVATRLWNQGIAKLLRRINPVRRHCAKPRVVKRKSSNGQPNVRTTNTIHNPPSRRNAPSLFTN